MIRATGQHLLFDADDTLWENHAYFLKVFEEFSGLMKERGHDPETVAAVLLRIEGERTRTRGYGSVNYALSLAETVEALEGKVSDGLRSTLEDFGRWIHDHPIELFPGVRSTLEKLCDRHSVLMVTKGDPREQRAKYERSGLADLIPVVEILPEKTPDHYRDVASRHSLPKDSSWMIGNSPKSDINPARAIGLKTVHIPHRSLWEFEAADLEARPDLILPRFRDLLGHF